MNGLVPGRIVYFVFDAFEAARAVSVGSQGNPVRAGDICPAMVVKVWGAEMANLKVMLDGPDTYWATSVHYSDEKLQRSWHWMFDGQNARYTPTSAAPPTESPV